MNLKGFRLNSGEVVIGDMTDKTITAYYLDQAAQLVMHDRGDGKLGVGMQPFIPFTKEVVELRNDSITAVFEPEDQISNEYSRIFGSGLLLPSQEILTHH